MTFSFRDLKWGVMMGLMHNISIHLLCNIDLWWLQLKCIQSEKSHLGKLMASELAMMVDYFGDVMMAIDIE